VNGDHDMISERMLKKIMYTIEVILKLKIMSDSDPFGKSFVLPRLDAILNYRKRKSNKIPVFDTKEVSITTNHKVKGVRHHQVKNHGKVGL
jgi:hypothetical protein